MPAINMMVMEPATDIAVREALLLWSSSRSGDSGAVMSSTSGSVGREWYFSIACSDPLITKWGKQLH